MPFDLQLEEDISAIPGKLDEAVKKLPRVVIRAEGDTIKHLVEVAKTLLGKSNLLAPAGTQRAYVAIIGQPGQSSITVHEVPAVNGAAEPIPTAVTTPPDLSLPPVEPPPLILPPIYGTTVGTPTDWANSSGGSTEPTSATMGDHS